MGLGQFLGDLDYEVLIDLIYIHSTIISCVPSRPWENSDDYNRQGLCFHWICIFERKRQVTNKALGKK